MSTQPEWQYHVASNKKLFYPYSSFAMALQTYVRTIVRDFVAKILYSLERLGATKTFLIHDTPSLKMKQKRKQLIEFWKNMFMNNSIISIDLLPEPKPDSYIMPNYVFDLEFPFSFYFMKQIDGFKTL